MLDPNDPVVDENYYRRGMEISSGAHGRIETLAARAFVGAVKTASRADADRGGRQNTAQSIIALRGNQRGPGIPRHSHQSEWIGKGSPRFTVVQGSIHRMKAERPVQQRPVIATIPMSPAFFLMNRIM